jgi:hypothetical protein
MGSEEISTEFDDDDHIILLDIEDRFLKFYDFVGKTEAFRLFERFRQTALSVTNVQKRKAILCQKLEVLNLETKFASGSGDLEIDCLKNKRS